MLDPVIDWGRLDQLMKSGLSSGQITDKIDQSMRNPNALRALLPGLILFFALDLQAELILRTSLDPDVQTRAKTKSALKCVIKGISKHCPGKGGVKWGEDYRTWDAYKKPINEFRQTLNRVGFGNLRTSLPRRGIVRNYLRGIEKMVNEIEKIVKEYSTDRVDESEYERVCIECMKRKCEKYTYDRAFESF